MTGVRPLALVSCAAVALWLARIAWSALNYQRSPLHRPLVEAGRIDVPDDWQRDLPWQP